MQSTKKDSGSDTKWFRRLMRWNDQTKNWNWGLIAVIGAVFVVIVFVTSVYIGNYRRTAFQNHVYCEVLKKGMSLQEVGAALDRVGKHIQVDITDQIVMNIEPKAVSYRLVLFEDAKLDLRMGLGYDSNQKLIWVTRGEIPPGQVVQCP